jgi:hypothetical protein
VYEVVVTTPDASEDLNAAVREFAEEWLTLSEPGAAERLVADPILVLAANGTVPIPRPLFVAHAAQRQVAASDSRTVLRTIAAQALGERMVVATVTWGFTHGDNNTELISDFLLQREASAGLRCVAYLPRTNAMDHVQPATAPATTDEPPR